MWLMWECQWSRYRSGVGRGGMLEHWCDFWICPVFCEGEKVINDSIVPPSPIMRNAVYSLCTLYVVYVATSLMGMPMDSKWEWIRWVRRRGGTLEHWCDCWIRHVFSWWENPSMFQFSALPKTWIESCFSLFSCVQSRKHENSTQSDYK